MNVALSMRTRLLLVVPVLIPLVALIAWLLWPKDTLHRLRNAFPSDCASITQAHLDEYPEAETSVMVRCEMAGPAATYARLRTASGVVVAIRHHRDETLNCVEGNELVSSCRYAFSRHEFGRICSDVGGRLAHI